MLKKIITGKTGICGIIGDPIEHSISPQLHNAAFNKLNLNYVYVPFSVKKQDLRKAIDGFRALNIIGFNVTIPHKVDILQVLDELDPLAEKIGAVNTVVNKRGVLKGYNTDAMGFLNSLTEHDINPDNKNVVILGAGGAARAISFILAQHGAKLSIINRTESKAQNLAIELSNTLGHEPNVFLLKRDNIARALKSADMLINTTSIGMEPDSNSTLVERNLLKKDLVVLDIVYSPAKTKLLKDAEIQGAVIITGLDMLVWQAALAFEKWTDIKAPVEIMRAEACTIIKT